jgi:hypothetical protein
MHRMHWFEMCRIRFRTSRRCEKYNKVKALDSFVFIKQRKLDSFVFITRCFWNLKNALNTPTSILTKLPTDKLTFSSASQSGSGQSSTSSLAPAVAPSPTSSSRTVPSSAPSIGSKTCASNGGEFGTDCTGECCISSSNTIWWCWIAGFQCFDHGDMLSYL